MKKLILFSLLGAFVSFLMAMGFASHVDQQKLKTTIEQNLAKYFDVESSREDYNLVQQKFDGKVQDYTGIEIKSVSSEIEIVASENEELVLDYPKIVGRELIATTQTDPKNSKLKTIVYDFEKYFENYNEDSTKLKINWNQAGVFNISTENKNRIKVKLPRNLVYNVFETTSGDIKIKGLYSKSLGLRTVSGDLKISNSEIQFLSLNSVSGGLKMNGKFSEAKIITVSGDVKLITENSPLKLDVETTSGDIKASTQNYPDATISFNSTSGGLLLAERLKVNQQYLDQNDRVPVLSKVVLGNGKAQWNFSTVSGDVKIE